MLTQTIKIASLLILCASIIGCFDEVAVPEGKTFSYTKLDANGSALGNQDIAWSDAAGASEANFNRWSCVLDNNTGLVWEVKTSYDDGALHASNNLYTWYDSDPNTNAGEHGIGDLGVQAATTHQTNPNPDTNPSDTQNGSDDCFDTSRCDTEKFVADVNAEGLCGSTNWRMPTREELAGLIYGTYQCGQIVCNDNELVPPGTGVTNIHPDYFPNISKATVNSRWLSSTTHDNELNLAGAVDFTSYSRKWVPKAGIYHIMLVHD